MKISNIIANGKERYPANIFNHKKNRSITLVVFTVLLWSFLAVLTTKLVHIPPFLQVGITLTLAGIYNIPFIKSWKVPPTTLAVGTLGIFGNLFFYYSAFKLAPPIEVNIINYIWPTLIVVLSPLFIKGYRLRFWNMLGVIICLAGTFLIISGGKTSFSNQCLPGYLSAFLGALVWAVYSLQIKRMPAFHFGAVGGFSLLSGVLGLLVYAIQRFNGLPATHIGPYDWLFLILLSLGPIAIANLTWKLAIEDGDPGIIGSLSYFIPLFSTINLALFAGQQITIINIVAMALILVGALVAGMETLKRAHNHFQTIKNK